MSRGSVQIKSVPEFDLDDMENLSHDYGDAVIVVPVGNIDYWHPANYDKRDALVASLVEPVIGDSPNAIDVHYSRVLTTRSTVMMFGDCAWTEDQLTKLARRIVKALAD